MRAGGSQSKGAYFERRICKELSKWVSNNYTYARDDLFWRSAMSGGRATIGKKQGEQREAQEGDISALGGDSAESKLAAKLMSKVVIECKSLKDYKLAKFVLTAEGPLADAMDQARCNDLKTPLVFAKANCMPTIIISDMRFFDGLDMKAEIELTEHEIGISDWDRFRCIATARSMTASEWDYHLDAR